MFFDYDRRERHGVNVRAAEWYINKSLSQEITSE